MARAKLSTFRFAILGLLGQQPMSGYDLLQVFSTTAMGHYGSSPGAVYPALKRLEEMRLICGHTERQDTLRPRRVFRLTPAGEEALRDWLSRPVAREDLIQGLDTVHLRFVFAGNLVGRDEAVRLLTEFARELEDYLPELEAQLAALPSELSVYAHHALEHGIEMHRLELRWARRVIASLERDGGD